MSRKSSSVYKPYFVAVAVYIMGKPGAEGRKDENSVSESQLTSTHATRASQWPFLAGSSRLAKTFKMQW